jgi:hypothetical protein
LPQSCRAIENEEFFIHSKDIVLHGKENVDQITPYVILLLFRRLAILQFNCNAAMNSAIRGCGDILVEFELFLRDFYPRGFDVCKKAIPQIFCQIISAVDNELFRTAAFLDRIP